MTSNKIGRNDPCSCGSGKKFKRCHLGTAEAALPVAGGRGLRIELVAPPPATGTDEKPDNPLARATRVLREHGKPFDKMAFVSFTDPTTGLLRWLGMFVHGVGGRVVFFPGFSEKYDRIACCGNAKGGGRFDKSFTVDHVTLEADRSTWHFSKAHGKHEAGGLTLDAEQGRRLWFGMTISTPDFLREMSATTRTFGPSPSDAETRRRFECFLKTVQAPQPVHLELPSKPQGTCVLHFAVTVAPTEAPLYTGPSIAVGGYVSVGTGGNSQASWGVARLAPDLDVQVLSMWLPGTAPAGVMFTSPVAT